MRCALALPQQRKANAGSAARGHRRTAGSTLARRCPDRRHGQHNRGSAGSGSRRDFNVSVTAIDVCMPQTVQHPVSQRRFLPAGPTVDLGAIHTPLSIWGPYIPHCGSGRRPHDVAKETSNMNFFWYLTRSVGRTSSVVFVPPSPPRFSFHPGGPLPLADFRSFAFPVFG